MKKNFLTVAAMTVVAFFVSAEIAKAADISFSGQVRTRWEYAEHLGDGLVAGGGGDARVGDSSDDFIQSSVRLAAKANINDTTSAFIQMQSNRTWGDTKSSAVGGGSGNSSGQVNNQDASVGIHQAYFTIKNFANLPMGWDAKVGRQEIKLDGWRLFGNTIWTIGMQTHDAVRMTNKSGNVTTNLAYILRQEDGRANDSYDTNDFDVYLAHINVKGVMGGQFSGYYVYSDNGCSPYVKTSADDSSRSCTNYSNNFHTIGGRQAGNMFGLKYRVEAYGQFGDATGIVSSSGASAHNSVTAGAQIDREAYMYGVRVGKAFNNVAYKPSVTLWYDYLSGTSDEDLAAGNWSSFDTLYDTGHKYYGLQDLFLGVGGGGQKGTQGLGLIDAAIKVKMNPVAGWTLKMDYHWFATAEGICGSPQMVGNAAAENANVCSTDDNSFLGNELDITAVNKWNANTKVMIGYSNFNASQNMRRIRAATMGADDANWAYVQFDVKF